MTLPNFIVIGAGKAGTRSLAAYLGAHPDVFVTNPKEPAFFSRKWHKGLDWYRSLFTGANGLSARGEASTSYTVAALYPDVPERIASVVPDARMIYLVRNPVERIRSHYIMSVELTREERDLCAILDEPLYLDASRYGHQLDRYLQYFARGQILVLSSEELRTNRRAALRTVFDFIEVEPYVVVRGLDQELNRSADVRRPGPIVEGTARALRWTGALRMFSAGTKRWVRSRLGHRVDVDVPPDLELEIWDRLAPDLRRLREIVGPEFDLWGHA